MPISGVRAFDNRLAKIRFAGFESDTMTLQRNGWQISAQQDQYRDAIRLALKHEPSRVYAVTNAVPYWQIMRLESPDATSHLCFEVQCIANDIRFQIMPITSAVDWFAIDAIPTVANYQERGIAEMVPFKPIGNDDVKELIIDPAKIGEIMDMILSSQDSKQKEIRENRRREAWRSGVGSKVDDIGYNPHRDIKAQLIAI